MQDLKDKLIVALDVSSKDDAEKFVNMLYPTVKMFKVGNQLFTACGPEVVKMIGKKGARVFLDLKFYDIPRTVYASTSSATAAFLTLATESSTAVEKVSETIPSPVFMMTVHIEGDEEMLREAVKGATEKANELGTKRPYIVGVTVLTSKNVSADIVLERARLAKKAGLDGVVCSVHEAQKIRSEFGKNFLIVTPGIRQKGSKSDDQARIATAQEAIDAGADFIVVGRPILEAKDPLAAVKNLL